MVGPPPKRRPGRTGWFRGAALRRIRKLAPADGVWRPAHLACAKTVAARGRPRALRSLITRLPLNPPSLPPALTPPALEDTWSRPQGGTRLCARARGPAPGRLGGCTLRASSTGVPDDLGRAVTQPRLQVRPPGLDSAVTEVAASRRPGSGRLRLGAPERSGPRRGRAVFWFCFSKEAGGVSTGSENTPPPPGKNNEGGGAF